jgi:hypothetical protein
MPVKIDADLRTRIVDAARKAVLEQGWPFSEPIDVESSNEDGDAVWIVTSNYMSRGRNAKVVLKQSDCSVKRAGYLAR